MKIWLKLLVGIIAGVLLAVFLPDTMLKTDTIEKTGINLY